MRSMTCMAEFGKGRFISFKKLNTNVFALLCYVYSLKFGQEMWVNVTLKCVGEFLKFVCNCSPVLTTKTLDIDNFSMTH